MKREERAQKFYELREGGATLEEIANTYFLTKSRVSQIIASYEREHQIPKAVKSRSDLKVVKSRSGLNAQELYELRASGVTTEEIASTYGVSVSRVSQLIKGYERELDLPSSAPRMKAFAQKAHEFRELKLGGATTEEIANMHGLAPASVNQIIKSYERQYRLPNSSKSDSEKRAEEFRGLRLKGTTLEDIASTYGLTRQRVDQIIKSHERKFNLPSSTKTSKSVAQSAKQADVDEYRESQRFEKQSRYKLFVPSFQLDAHLVGRFLHTLGNRSVLYSYAGKSRSNPKGRKDGTPYPSQDTPTRLMMNTGTSNKNQRQVIVHSWVLQQYGVKVEKGQHCHHRDGDITNNMLENLQVLSNEEHGRLTWQEQLEKGTIDFKNNPRHQPMLTEEQVEEIRALYQPGVISSHTLAEKYGVDYRTVLAALYGEGAYVNVNPATCRVQKRKSPKKKESSHSQIPLDFPSKPIDN